ncbi:hypothetical protein PTRA_a2614 [Pseudoalteromonas translucida KMM 520]|uniref:Cellulose biosynthesis protein BcsE n=1 Tax=Pseudoalteromonas translucida KMM 520 TaxID=1315283 RepID=A0A0U2WF61_9GAMM|nr:cellulose biosynthesis protein BcsE [Pseudoalteromonas translucida]ALS33687.1 hypothetical protein PTRA_a2614 [Pseudoalteromonas translucida KMM 520]
MHQLNISGLEPFAKELQTASSYAVLAPQDNIVIEFVLHCVNESYLGDVFIVSTQVESFFDLPSSTNLITAYENKQVYPFSFSAQKKDLGVKLLVKKMLNELSAYSEITESLIFIHFSTEQLESIKEPEVEQLIEYFTLFIKRTNATLLLLVSGPEIVKYRFIIRSLNKLFDGSVFIDDAATRTLDYDYWRHSSGIFTNEQYQLVFKNKQLIAQKTIVNEAKKHGGKNFFDEDDVWLVQSAVPEGTKLPVYYQTVKDNKDLFDKGPRLAAATLVFSVTRYTDLTQLAKHCFELRKHCGRWLKLVIQNVDGIIRHQDECLFLTLGVNLILYSFSEPSRLLSQIQSIQGFQFSRPLPPSVEHVLQYTENTFSKGYLPFIEFTRQVEIHSDSAVNLGVSGVLVKLELLPRIDPIHPLHLFHIKREGDVFSVADNTIYLYLHACRENDVDNAIKHLFKLEISDFFVQQNLISDHFYIQQECKQLRRFYKDKSVIDYSEQLTENNSYEFAPSLIVNTAIDIESPELVITERADATPIVMKLRV